MTCQVKNIQSLIGHSILFLWKGVTYCGAIYYTSATHYLHKKCFFRLTSCPVQIWSLSIINNSLLIIWCHAVGSVQLLYVNKTFVSELYPGYRWLWIQYSHEGFPLNKYVEQLAKIGWKWIEMDFNIRMNWIFHSVCWNKISWNIDLLNEIEFQVEKLLHWMWSYYAQWGSMLR